MTSARPSSEPGHARGAHGPDGAAETRAARIKRNAWLLAALALAFYVGYIGWMFWRGVAGG